MGFINRIIFFTYDYQTEFDLIKMKHIVIKKTYPNKLVCDLTDKNAINFKK